MPLEADRDEAAAWSKEFKVAFPVLFDPQRKIAQAYGVNQPPVNVAIDRDGKVVNVLVGLDLDALDSVANALAGKPGE